VGILVGEAEAEQNAGTLKVSCICVTKGIEPPSRMKTALPAEALFQAAGAFRKIGA